MSSPRFSRPVRTGSRTESIGPLLDSMFGLFVWAAHFLIIYTVTATACQTALRYASPGSRSGLVIALELVTAVAAAVVLLHGMSRRRRFLEDSERQFRMWATIGLSALATVAIVWQLFAFLLVPLCV